MVLSRIPTAALTPAQAAGANSLQQPLALEALAAIARTYQMDAVSATVKAPLFQCLHQQLQQWQRSPASAHRDYAIYALEQWVAGKPWPLKPAPELPPGSPI